MGVDFVVVEVDLDYVRPRTRNEGPCDGFLGSVEWSESVVDDYSGSGLVVVGEDEFPGLAGRCDA